MKKPIEFSITSNGLVAAAKMLREGATVAFPTETVYGLGADATNPEAVAKIYAAKGRPSFNPLIAHVSDKMMADEIVVIDDTAASLMDAFWPGDLTLILPIRPNAKIAQAVTAGLPTLAVRMPNHPIALELLGRAGRPIAAPSANPSGRVSPTTAQHVKDGLQGRIDGLVMGPACTVGVESTILALTPEPQILRPGGITKDQIEKVLGLPVGEPSITPSTITAPGQLSSHYAPSVPVRLNAKQAVNSELLIGFGDITGERTLSAKGDLAEAAEVLFSILLDCETQGRPLAFAPIPETGIGIAINDRLRRAAAPRG